MSGFTLVEVLLTIAILGIITTAGIINVTSFQKTAKLDSTVNELVNNLRLAQSQSTAGQLPPGTTADDYELNGLPRYGIEVSLDNYSLIAQSTLLGQTQENQVLQSFPVTSPYSLTPPGTIIFDRITGQTATVTLTFQDTITSRGSSITITPSGSVNTNPL